MRIGKLWRIAIPNMSDVWTIHILMLLVLMAVGIFMDYLYFDIVGNGPLVFYYEWCMGYLYFDDVGGGVR